MSRVLGPLLSLSASKTFGKTLTFANWKGVNTVRLKSNPSNPKTVEQMTARGYFAAGGKMSKASDPFGTLADYIKPITPAQQSWISYLVSKAMGVNYATIIAAYAAYNLVGNATVKGYFDDAAAQANVQPVNIGSEAYEQATAGAVLAAAYFGAQATGYSGAATAFADLSEGDVFSFTEDLTGILPT